MLLHEHGADADTALHASSYLDSPPNPTITDYGAPQSLFREGDSVKAL